MKDLKETVLDYGVVHVNTSIRRTDRLGKVIENYYVRMSNSGAIARMYLEGDVRTVEDFFDSVNATDGTTFFAIDPDTFEVVAHWMVNSFRGLAADIHFAIDPRYHGSESLRMAYQALGYTFSLTRAEDRALPFVETVIAAIPSYNSIAVKFSEKLGYQHIAELSNFYYCVKRGTYVSAKIMTLTKETLIDPVRDL